MGQAPLVAGAVAGLIDRFSPHGFTDKTDKTPTRRFDTVLSHRQN